MKKYFLFLTVVVILFGGCAKNNYQAYYKSTNFNEFARPNIDSTPEVITDLDFNNLLADRKKMYEDGYTLIGFSNFTGQEAHSKNEHIMEMSKQLNASKVFAYKKSLGEVSNGSISTYIGYGMSINTPVVSTRFEYLADYYQKTKRRTCGCLTGDLSDEKKRQIGSNKGVQIVNVIKKHPAYEADIVAGDVVLKINEIQIEDNKHFNEVLDKFIGKKVTFYIYRDGKYLGKTVQLNTPEI